MPVNSVQGVRGAQNWYPIVTRGAWGTGPRHEKTPPVRGFL
jgi:hypothetical protein